MQVFGAGRTGREGGRAHPFVLEGLAFPQVREEGEGVRGGGGAVDAPGEREGRREGGREGGVSDRRICVRMLVLPTGRRIGGGRVRGRWRGRRTCGKEGGR